MYVLADSTMNEVIKLKLTLKLIWAFVLQFGQIFCQYRSDIVVLGTTLGPGYARIANEGKYLLTGIYYAIK